MQKKDNRFIHNWGSTNIAKGSYSIVGIAMNKQVEPVRKQVFDAALMQIGM